jgi:hypothetical protein
MIPFQRWREETQKENESVTFEVGPYKMTARYIGDSKILLGVSSKEESSKIDSKAVIQRVVDVSNLDKIGTGDGAVSFKWPVINPVDNRSNEVPIV